MWLEVRDPDEYFLVPIDINKTVGPKFNSRAAASVSQFEWTGLSLI